MADLTHESSEEAFHEIQLSGKQLVFLFMATTVVAVVIFICGVLVGRGVRAEDIGMDPALAAAADPVPVAQEPPAAVPADPPAEPPLSYHQRLESEKSPAEDLKPRLEPQPLPPDTARAAAPPAEPKPAPSSGPYTPKPGTWAVQVQALRDREAAAQVVQRLRGKGYPAFLIAPTSGAPTQLFRVQVGRYSGRAEAEDVGSRLKKEEQFDYIIVR